MHGLLIGLQPIIPFLVAAFTVPGRHLRGVHKGILCSQLNELLVSQARVAMFGKE